MNTLADLRIPARQSGKPRVSGQSGGQADWWARWVCLQRKRTTLDGFLSEQADSAVDVIPTHHLKSVLDCSQRKKKNEDKKMARRTRPSQPIRSIGAWEVDVCVPMVGQIAAVVP